jgi:predicted nucleic acid-binding protein
VIVLDANVVIAYLDDRDAHHAYVVDLLESNAFDEFACSVLTVAEALVHPTRSEVQDAAVASLQRIGIRILPMGDHDALELARLRSQYGVRMPDAVVLRTALTNAADVATLDEALATAAARAGIRRAIVEND